MALNSNENTARDKNLPVMSRKEAVALAKRWATSYYEGQPEVSDDKFDALVDLIRALWPDEKLPYLVGFGYEVKGEKRPHKVPTRSLPKIKENEFVNDKPDSVRVTPKYDGISVVLYYENGKLVDALPRGGGEGTGKPILHNLFWSAKVQGLCEMDPSVMAISAEVVVYVQAFEKHLSDEYELPRSAAAGIAQTQSCHPKRGLLRVEPFRIHFEDGRTLAITDEINEAEFRKYVPFAKSHPVADPLVLKSWTTSLYVPTDGVVLWDELALKFRGSSLLCVGNGKIELSGNEVDDGDQIPR